MYSSYLEAIPVISFNNFTATPAQYTNNIDKKHKKVIYKTSNYASTVY